MVGRDITPTEIGKHSKLIKAAQDDMANMDVLVCGRCLTVCHFIEDFKQHKLKPCQKENNNVRECNDTKPKIWAYLLWKATQLHNNKETNIASPNSWALYQTWVKMEESLRETWIVAGKTIQSFAKVGQGNLQEMPVKITKTVVNNNADSTPPGRKPLTQTKPQVANLKPPMKLPVLNKSLDTENDTSKSLGVTPPIQKIIKKPINPGVQSKAAFGSVGLNKTLSRRAKRTLPNSDDTTEENVEKIMAKRFNPRRKMYEYLVKWEGCTNDQNTWEPSSNLDNVPHLLDTFEKQLARQKETRAAQQAKQASLADSAKPVDVQKVLDVNRRDGEPKLSPSPGGDGSIRPSRTSKTRALDQVKQWVAGSSGGAASPASTGGGSDGGGPEPDWSMNTSHNSSTGDHQLPAGVKRKLDDSDYNDSNASDFNANAASSEDLEEDLIPSHTVKRLRNGNAVSVEVKAKQSEPPKIVKVNGTSARSSESSTPKSAEVIITQDTTASGVVKKPGFSGPRSNSHKTEAQIRVLSKGESAVSNSGIVRVGGGAGTVADGGSGEAPQQRTAITSRVQQQIRTPGRPTATQANSTGSGIGALSTPITVSNRQHTLQRTPTGTTIQRKTITVGGQQQQQQRTVTHSSSQQQSGRTGLQQASPSSGRMIIPRSGAASAGRASSTAALAGKTVTPEQKILQLSKSGDLKVTKKVMTREDVMAQRLAQQQQRQQQMRQQQQQSQVQIQKVQQITPPTARSGSAAASLNARKPQAAPQPPPPQEEEEHQAQLCPITGKLLGPDGEPLPSPQPPQPTAAVAQSGGAVLQTQMAGDQTQLVLQQEQQQQHEIDPTLLLTGDQQLLTNEDGTPLLVTGEDGTVYQVAGKNAEGQTILVTQGPDGEQQFAYVAAADGDDSQQVLTLDNAVAEAVAQLPAEQQAEALAAAAAGEGQYVVKTTQEDGTTQVVTMTGAELAQHQALAAAAAQQQQVGEGSAASAGGGAATGQLCIQTGGEGGEGQEANIPAEVVQADLPSPGGTRRVVLLLQDGTYMMTEMHDDEFKALNIAT